MTPKKIYHFLHSSMNYEKDALCWGKSTIDLGLGRHFSFIQSWTVSSGSCWCGSLTFRIFGCLCRWLSFLQLLSYDNFTRDIKGSCFFWICQSALIGWYDQPDASLSRLFWKNLVPVEQSGFEVILGAWTDCFVWSLRPSSEVNKALRSWSFGIILTRTRILNSCGIEHWRNSTFLGIDMLTSLPGANTTWLLDFTCLGLYWPGGGPYSFFSFCKSRWARPKIDPLLLISEGRS